MTSENTAPVSERGEWSAWLIERGGQWYAAAPHSRWTTQQAIDASTWRENWTSDANKALRFARKCDAETLIRYESLQNAVATEHVWLEREEWPDLRDPRNIRRALEYDECWECGGAGGWNSCMEDCCMAEGGEEGCTDPICWRCCPNCKGIGALPNQTDSNGERG